MQSIAIGRIGDVNELSGPVADVPAKGVKSVHDLSKH
jgi:hypothetical protein